MGDESLPATYQRWINELWNGPSDESSLQRVAAELVTDDFVGHWPDHDVDGAAGLAAIIAQTKGMFSTLTFEIQIQPFAVNGFVAARWAGHGQSAQGTAHFFGHDILRAMNSRFAEYWVVSASL